MSQTGFSEVYAEARSGGLCSKVQQSVFTSGPSAIYSAAERIWDAAYTAVSNRYQMSVDLTYEERSRGIDMLKTELMSCQEGGGGSAGGSTGGGSTGGGSTGGGASGGAVELPAVTGGGDSGGLGEWIPWIAGGALIAGAAYLLLKKD